MENEFTEIFETCKQVTEIMTKLDRNSFMTIMCMLFDEYHNTHPDFDAPENAQVVADLVREVNTQLGEYVNN